MILLSTVILGFALAELSISSQASVLSLDGADWIVSNTNKSIRIAANVPGGIYTDLMRGGIIGDPYFRFNDVGYRWIGYENWTFAKTFQVTEELLGNEKVILVCHGLDTVSDVILNGHVILSTNNMFVRYVLDIKDKLQVGENYVEVRFVSPVKYAERKSIEQSLKYDIPPSCPPPVQKGECHVNFIRKIQSSFSWDWGPSFPSQGIWKKIEIQAYNSAIVRDLTVFTKLDKMAGDERWNLEVNVFLERSQTCKGGNLSIRMDKWLLTTQTVVFQDTTPLNTTITVKIPVPQNIPIALWWPNGYGEQKLYNLTVSFTDGVTFEASQLMKRIGFRTVELVQDDVVDKEEEGKTFFFRINGVAMFAKGSNLIPLDSFPERVTPEYIKWLMKSTVDANMNMLRIWGGGMYEVDYLYDIADEMGILLWQDMMFACALYPVDNEFLASVSQEITQQVRRLQTHPSICLWSGNNENEGAIAQIWWPQIFRNVTQYKEDYIKLYIDTMRTVIEKEDPTRPFLVSSPTNNLPAERAGGIDIDPQNQLYGDVHYYNYVDDGWNWTIYPRPRFASEYGFQSFPSFKTLANVSIPSDWTYPKNDFLEHRQHHIFGNLEMQTSIRRQFLLPSRLADFLYLSQVTQAMSIKTETEHYRRSMSDLIEGKGYTMGALYWQLNDIWQGASWSSIEYPGKWKMLHYFAKEFFAPVLITPYLDGNNIKVVIVSDLLKPVQLNLKISVYAWSSFTPKYKISSSFNQPAQLSKLQFSNTVQNFLKLSNCKALEECFLYFEISDTQQPEPLSKNFLFLSSFKNAVGIRKANIQVKSLTQIDVRQFKIVLESDRIAPFVWLEASDILGSFSENGFLMINATKIIYFNSNRDTSMEELAPALTVQSLMDAQQNVILERDALAAFLLQK